ncbi:putative phosphorelay response regulator, partial [Operophtera brumata]
MEGGMVRWGTWTSHQNRLDTPLLLTINTSKANSAVQQLFNRLGMLAGDQRLKTRLSDAWPRGTHCAAHSCAQETTSLAERIRLLTCDVEDEPEERSSPVINSDKLSDKSFDKNSEKAFGSASSSSSSSTLSVPVPTRQQPPDLGDVHLEPQKFLSTLAPLTACVGSAAHHEGFYYVPPGDRGSASAATNLDFQDHNEAPAPDVVAGTPGFHRRPAVRGIAVKRQLGASDDILAQMQQMQNDLQPQTNAVQAQMQAHSCQRTNTNYSW